MFEKVLIFLMNMTPLTEQKHSCCLKVVLAVPGYSILVRVIDLPGLFPRSRNMEIPLCATADTAPAATPADGECTYDGIHAAVVLLAAAVPVLAVATAVAPAVAVGVDAADYLACDDGVGAGFDRLPLSALTLLSFRAGS